MGPNNWGIFLILPVTTGEGIGPAGESSPVVCMLKNGLPVSDRTQPCLTSLKLMELAGPLGHSPRSLTLVEVAMN